MIKNVDCENPYWTLAVYRLSPSGVDISGSVRYSFLFIDLDHHLYTGLQYIFFL